MALDRGRSGPRLLSCKRLSDGGARPGKQTPLLAPGRRWDRGARGLCHSRASRRRREQPRLLSSLDRRLRDLSSRCGGGPLEVLRRPGPAQEGRRRRSGNGRRRAWPLWLRRLVGCHSSSPGSSNTRLRTELVKRLRQKPRFGGHELREKCAQQRRRRAQPHRSRAQGDQSFPPRGLQRDASGHRVPRGQQERRAISRSHVERRRSKGCAAAALRHALPAPPHRRRGGDRLGAQALGPRRAPSRTSTLGTRRRCVRRRGSASSP